MLRPTSNYDPQEVVAPTSNVVDSAPQSLAAAPTQARLRAKLRRAIRPTVLSVASLIILLAVVRIDVEQLRVMLSNLSTPLLFSLLACEGSGQLMRSLRLQVLMDRQLAIVTTIRVMCCHQFYAFFLPFGAGGLSLPFLLKSHNIPRAQSFGVLVVMRLLDLAMVTGTLSLLLFVFNTALPLAMQRLWFVAITSAAILIAVVCTVILGPYAMNRLERLVPADLTRWLVDRHIVFSNAWMKVSWRHLALASVLTLCFWICNCSYAVLLAHALVPHLDLRFFVILCFAMPLVSQLPIHGLAGLGTGQALVVVFFTMAGLSSAEALAFSLIAYPIRIGIAVLYGVVGFTRLPHTNN